MTIEETGHDMESIAQSSALFANWQLWAIAIALNTILLSWVALAPKKLLTPAGAVHAGILGVVVWGCLGWPGYAVVGFYFLVGSAVTRVGLARKEAAGIAEKRSGARGPENVWGSAAVAAICAIAVGLLTPLTPMIPTAPASAAHGLVDLTTYLPAWMQPLVNPISAVTRGTLPSTSAIALLCLAYVASFSTKLSDTCASEVGKAYGRRTFSLLTLQPVPPGTEGAVSLEGTLAGIVGSIAQGLVGLAVGLISPLGLVWCAIAALVATTAESLIGATLQPRFAWLTNEWVNGINTAIGAIVAVLLALGFGAQGSSPLG